MKVLILLIHLLALGFVFGNQAQQWAQHDSGHELLTTLIEESDTVFVVLWYKNLNRNPEVKKINTKARIEINELITKKHPGAVYTEVDMSTDNRNAYTYERLATKQLGINLAELEYGPIVVVIKNGFGQQIIFRGDYNDFFDTVHKTVHQVNIENEKEDTKPIPVIRKEVQESAKNKTVSSGPLKYDYYRPEKYNKKEYQKEERYKQVYDPTYNENPVAAPKPKKEESNSV